MVSRKENLDELLQFRQVQLDDCSLQLEWRMSIQPTNANRVCQLPYWTVWKAVPVVSLAEAVLADNS